MKYRVCLYLVLFSFIPLYSFMQTSSIIYLPDTDVMGTLGDGVFEVGSFFIVNDKSKFEAAGKVNVGFLHRMELGLTVRGKNYVSGNAKVLLLQEYGSKPAIAAGIMDISTTPNIGRARFVDFSDSLATNPTNSAGYVVISKFIAPVSDVYLGFTTRTLGNSETLKNLGGVYFGVARRIWKIRLMGEVGSKGINLGTGFNIWWINMQMAMTQLQNLGSSDGKSPYFAASLSITNMEIKREEQERLKRLANEKYLQQIGKRPPIAPTLPFRPFMGHPGGPFGATTSIVTVPNTITLPKNTMLVSSGGLISYKGDYWGSNFNIGYGIMSFMEAGISIVNFNDELYYQGQIKATILREQQNYPAIAAGVENITWQGDIDPTKEGSRFQGETWYESRNTFFQDRSFSPFAVFSKHFGYGLTAYIGAGARSFTGYGRTTHKFQGMFFGVEKDLGPVTLSGEMGGRDFNAGISYRYKKLRISAAILEAQHIPYINDIYYPYFGVGVSYIIPFKKAEPID
ncbi:MAG: hypothetical protein JXA60_01040 [Candidatus Coatesbacteria bacterium]|nr:hypothetical protein [Candidatus Coatesbacteria bacterium]